MDKRRRRTASDVCEFKSWRWKSGRELPQSKSWRKIQPPSSTRSVLDCASPLAFCLRVPISIHFKFIRHGNPVRLETVDGFYHRGRSRAFKPRSRAKRILIRHQHQPVFHRVLMDIVEPRQIRMLMRQSCFPKIEPDLSSGCLIQFVHPLRRFDVQHTQHIAQAGGVLLVRRRVGDEVVMIGEHGPRFQLPVEFFCDGQQAAM